MSDQPTEEEFKKAVAQMLTDAYFQSVKPLLGNPAFLGIKHSPFAMKKWIELNFANVDDKLHVAHQVLSESGYCCYKPKSPAARD